MAEQRIDQSPRIIFAERAAACAKQVAEHAHRALVSPSASLFKPDVEALVKMLRMYADHIETECLPRKPM